MSSGSKGKGGGGGGQSTEEVLNMQRTLARESFERQQEATLAAEARAEERREQERLEEIERRRQAELDKAAREAEEEQRESMLMGEAEGGTVEDQDFANLNLEAPQIEAPDYAERTELE